MGCLSSDGQDLEAVTVPSSTTEKGCKGALALVVLWSLMTWNFQGWRRQKW